VGIANPLNVNFVINGLGEWLKGWRKKSNHHRDYGVSEVFCFFLRDLCLHRAAGARVYFVVIYFAYPLYWPLLGLAGKLVIRQNECL